jgi:predicted membrane-bound mannosyltransferase/DNA-binding beta-propeller fold protein YncE
MTTSNASQDSNTTWLDRKLPPFLSNINIEKVIFAIIIILAIVSRFYILGARVMSHDEVNHVRPSWELYTGQGYRHDPVTHGPMQFHLVALSYLLLGDNDFTSRLPAALFSIATVMMMWKYRRYFGRAGALMAGLFMLISPYLLFYGRYTRNEAFVALWGVITIYAVLRYLEEGKDKFLLLLAGIFSLQFATKETAFIYSAQILLFLLLLFLKRLYDKEWMDDSKKRPFLMGLIIGAILIILAAGLAVIGGKTPVPVDPAVTIPIVKPFIFSTLPIILLGLALIDITVAIIFLVRGLGFSEIRNERSFDLLILIGTFVLPQLTALPIKLMGWDPLDYSSPALIRTGIFLAVFIGISAAIGIWWRSSTWLKSAVIFYGIYIFFYTTIFTNGQGFFTGIIGSLGYWLAQQSVQRGSQPLYYYALIQIPMYEFLPAIGSILGIYYAIRLWLKKPATEREVLPEFNNPDPLVEKKNVTSLFILTFLIFWVVSALLAYSYAGERMPWLTVHIALPMILLAGYSFGMWVEKINWSQLLSKWGWLVVTFLILLVVASARLLTAFMSPIPPFSGNGLDQLSATTAFIFAALFFIGAVGGLVYIISRWKEFQYGHLFGVIVLVGLIGLTVRAAYRANYINYDTAKEYLVYAHAARGPKDILAQVEEISERIAGGKNLKIAYDNHSLYPYWWYFRDYPNLDYFGEQPSKTLKDDPIVLVGNPNYDKVDPILNKGFYKFEYLRLWWPNQDYYELTPQRVWNAITDPKIRAGIFDIWLNRDYTQYAEATGSTTMTLETWEPAERIRLYINKNIASQIWDLGLVPVAAVEEVDPYAKVKVDLQPDLVIGGPGKDPGLFDAPRGLAIAPDGSLFVADSRNNRIQHLRADGSIIGIWGSFADSSKGDAAGGTFNEPWGVAIGPDGSVYVTDTWNHRVEKFDANGNFITMWGYFGQAEKPEAFWGPRGIYVDVNNRVFVVDTGNKRIVVFDSNGAFITQFGTYGLESGQFDEPVGVWGDKSGNIYVADTWNQRIQVFSPDATGANYGVSLSWDVNAWNGQSLDNKPFLTVDGDGNVFAVDPEGYRILEFGSDGNIIRTWGDYSLDTDGFGLASGVAVDPQSNIWVSDGANMRLLHFIVK